MPSETIYTVLISFIVLLCLQLIFPKREFDTATYIARFHNGLLFLVNYLIFKFCIPLSLLAAAFWAETNQFGLANQFSEQPWWSIALTIIALDFAIYWQHVASHKWYWLWRIHRVHHFDLEMDITTAVRFHPIELLLSLFYKITLVLLLGASVMAVAIFEALLLIGAMFNHSNLKLPINFERYLRYIIVTPDMHRIHHSADRKEHDSNYGFFIPWWDFWFNSYTQTPKGGHQKMQVGLKQNRDQAFCSRLINLLKIPFIG